MKIIKIVKIASDKCIQLTSQNFTLFELEVTAKNFWGRVKTFRAYPTSFGPTFGTNCIHWFEFVDELGKPFDDDICEQLTIYCKIRL